MHRFEAITYKINEVQLINLEFFIWLVWFHFIRLLSKFCVIINLGTGFLYSCAWPKQKNPSNLVIMARSHSRANESFSYPVFAEHPSSFWAKMFATCVWWNLLHGFCDSEPVQDKLAFVGVCGSALRSYQTNLFTGQQALTCLSFMATSSRC